MPIPVIDLFAGPGGLAEGFSSVLDEQGTRAFDIRLSIEKDAHAHQTLKLRAFIRQFPLGTIPADYYDFLEQRITIEELYRRFPVQYDKAIGEAWQATLGQTSEAEIDERVTSQLEGAAQWVLIGGPPCQAYSLAGRSRVGGISAQDNRVHLYKEYLRIIARFQPSVFVMENVKGLLSAKVEGEQMFERIMQDLRAPGTVFPEFECPDYNIYSLVTTQVEKNSDYLIRSEDYGIPQRRHRVILIGVRSDLGAVPESLVPRPAVSLASVIGTLPAIRSGLYRESTGSELVVKDGTVKKKRNYRPLIDSEELWQSLMLRYMDELKQSFRSKGLDIANLPTRAGLTGREFFPSGDFAVLPGHPLHQWFTDSRLRGLNHHHSRSHLSIDLKRYLFASLYAREFGNFPRMEDYREFGEDLLPDHENAESGKFNDRFRVQLPGQPATTITSHISKDGHYFIHYDPAQSRSLTVREAARVQTFPDNYFFCGSRTQQFHQVGNAVPPYLAYQIAEITKALFD